MVIPGDGKVPVPGLSVTSLVKSEVIHSVAFTFMIEPITGDRLEKFLILEVGERSILNSVEHLEKSDKLPSVEFKVFDEAKEIRSFFLNWFPNNLWYYNEILISILIMNMNSKNMEKN